LSKSIWVAAVAVALAVAATPASAADGSSGSKLRGDLNCADFDSQADAQQAYENSSQPARSNTGTAATKMFSQASGGCAGAAIRSKR